jgi:pumilio RNA-binding family
MQRPWEIDQRNNRQDVAESLKEFERSTSAPPPETSLLFGSRKDTDEIVSFDSTLSPGFLADTERLNIEDPQHQQYRHNHLTNYQAIPSSVNNNYPFPSPVSPSGKLTYARDEIIRSQDHHQMIGETLIRPHSATPIFDSRLSVGLPPGFVSRQETPPHSNQSSVTIRSNVYVEDQYADRSQIFQLGQRRPASTGVIGDSQSSSSSIALNSLGLGTTISGKAARPTAKTLMDLIQEDLPRETLPIESGSLYDDSIPIFHQKSTSRALERPRTTSPLSSQYMRGNHDYHDTIGRDLGSIRNSIDLSQINKNDLNLSDPMNRLYLDSAEEISYRQNTNTHKQQARPIPQYASGSIPYAPESVQGDDNVQRSLYAPVAYHPRPTRPQPQNTRHYSSFESQGGRYGSPPQPQQLPAQVQTQVLPSGHTVYVNATSPPPPPPQYSYATIQYHQHPQHHIMHQTVSGGIPPPASQQYISIVPVQQRGGPTGHLQSVSPRGSYTYWQPPDGHQSGPHTVRIVRPGMVPMKVTHQLDVPNNSKLGTTESQQHKQKRQGASSHGGRSKDKNGKGRRNSSRNNSNAGGAGCIEAKPSPPAHHINSDNSLLEDYKAKKNNRDWTVCDIKGHVVQFCQDQNGSRFIQQRLEIGDDVEKLIVMTEVLPEVVRLRNDVFGNYVVQKLLGFGTDKMKEDLRHTMTGEMVQLSMQIYGCRVVQKALECVVDRDLPDLLSEFENNVLNLIHDQNGNHVIQKCIEVLSRKAKMAQKENEDRKSFYFGEQIDFIVEDVIDNLAALACHPYGCRVLQRILEYCVDRQKSKALEKIGECLRTLFDDQYGNYVIQHVLQFGRVKDRDMVLEMVVNNGLLKVSRQKFASNVVEKLLKYGNAEQRKSIVREMLKVVDGKTDTLIKDSEQGTSVVLLMVRDPYANYVVQTTLDVVPESEEKVGLLKELNAHSLELKNYTFAKHIITKLDS